MSSDDLSSTRHTDSRDGFTLSNGAVTGNAREEIMPMSVLVTHIPDTDDAPARTRQYLAPMTVAALAVAEVLLTRRPGIGPSRLHGLLYLSQGHHLAITGEPLFAEPIYATAEAAVVADLAEAEEATGLTNAQLNTVGYVISRYGNLSAADLRTLIRGSDPWQLATARPEDPRVEMIWLQDWFQRAADQVEQGEPHLSREQRAGLVARATTQAPGPGEVTTREGLLARIESLRERSASAP
jgi:uncharacterized phage-associated protein